MSANANVSAASRRAWFFLAPALALVTIFVAWPVASALRLAFFETDGLGHTRFVGLGNFIELARDPLLWVSLRNLAVFGALTVPLQTFGPLLGAKLLHSLGTGRSAYWYRTLLVVPVVVPGVVTLLTWQQIYANEGPLNQTLRAVGLDAWTHSWLGEPGTVIPAIVAMGMPWTGGVFVLLYLAAFMAIPNSLYEAARLDWARSWQIFWHIELPMLKPQMRLIAALSFLGIVQNFENIQILTNGGPINASLTPALHLFKNGFEFGQLGYASALGVVLLVATAALVLASQKLGRAAS
ncbi:MAG TPA: sugar ABC transporter permease [Opitutaceae bacterium]